VTVSPANLTTIAPKLAKICLMLSSDCDHEVVAAARAIDKTLQSAGFDWHDLVATLFAPRPVTQIISADWRREVRFCTSHFELLTNWERDFIATLAEYRGRPTDKQMRLVRDIAARLQRAA
jgi:hypothetical protein